METRPSVSVVIPCYNYGRFLPAAVGSALDQPGIEVDVLIVDDASSDGSLTTARQLAAKDPRIKVLAHVENKGHIATYNDGLERAQGDYVVLLSADDLLTPASLTRSAALMENFPDVVLTYGYAHTFSETPPAPNLRIRNWSVWSGPAWTERIFRRGHNAVTNPEAMIRTSVMRKLGGYSADLPHAADMYLWLQAALYGGVGRVNGPDQAFYREHGGNMHLTDYSGLFIDMTERRAVFERLLEQDLARSLDRPHLNALFRRAIARDSLRLGCQAIDLGGVHGGVTAEQFAEFAVATWPMADRMRAWSALQRRSSGPSPEWRLKVASEMRNVRGAARWRRWRRFGT